MYFLAGLLKCLGSKFALSANAASLTHDLYKQVDQHIMNYVNAAGIDNKDHWVEPHLPDLERDLKEEVGIEFD